MSPPASPSFRRSFMQAALAVLGATALGIAACGGGGDAGSGSGGLGASGPLQVSDNPTTLGRATVLGAELSSPWALAFIENGRMLITEKGGTLALVEADGNSVLARISGLPAVSASGQGGLLDVAYRDGWVYFTYAEPGAGGTSGTALARAQLVGTALQNLQVLWQQVPKVVSDIHFGSRIAFRSDGTLMLAVGERGVEANDGTAKPDGVQNPANTLGKVLRLNADGSVPADNPSFAAGAAAGLWSRGHRNPQGAAVRPGSNELWITEHGPQGGDELNQVAGGANFGWPIRSYGCNYGDPIGDACRIGGGTHAPTYTEPKSIWVPTSTAPSGLAFYTGAAFPEWQGSVFAGALAGATLWRIALDASGNAVSRQEVAAVKALNVRIRDVRQGPDGNLYLLTNGSGANADRLVRLAP
jgi:glucose/arabinose dehydrogenase